MADASPEIRPHGPARKPGVLANVLAIIGFIILMIIVIWGVLHIISLSSPWFSSLFDGGKKEISISAPSTVVSKTPFNISWKYSTANRGTYAILYQCADGLKMTVDGNAIPCGAAYTLGNATGSATILPTLASTKSVQSSISVLFIPSAAGTTGPEATGSTNVNVVTGSTTQKPPVVIDETPTPTPAPTPTPTPVPAPTPKPVTPSDLSVSILAVGVIDPYTGAFVARAPYNSTEISAVQFDIKNIGGSPSGAYTFEAQIPTTQPYTFQSQVQPSLAASAHVVNTLRFSPAVNGTFSVQVLGSDGVKSNNVASQWVTGAYSAYQPQYPAYQY